MRSGKFKLTAVIIIIAIVILSPIFYLINNLLSFPESFDCKQTRQPIILSDKSLVQSFTPSQKNLATISLKVATYNKIVSGGIILIQIKNKYNESIFEKQIRTIQLEDNKFTKIKIPKEILEKDSQYYLEIKFLKTPKEKIAFWNTDKKCYPGLLSLGDKEIEKSNLIMYLQYSRENKLAGINDLVERMSQYKALWIKDKNIVLIFFVYLITLLIFPIYIAKKIF